MGTYQPVFGAALDETCSTFGTCGCFLPYMWFLTIKILLLFTNLNVNTKIKKTGEKKRQEGAALLLWQIADATSAAAVTTAASAGVTTALIAPAAGAAVAVAATVHMCALPLTGPLE